jgi:hypothetical protein
MDTGGRDYCERLGRVPTSGGKALTVYDPDPSRGELYHGHTAVLPGAAFCWAASEKPENRGIYGLSLSRNHRRVKR